MSPDAIDVRHLSVTYLHQYSTQRAAGEEAWKLYNLKLEECSTFEAAPEGKPTKCDTSQSAMRTNGREQAEQIKEESLGIDMLKKPSRTDNQ